MATKKEPIEEVQTVEKPKVPDFYIGQVIEIVDPHYVDGTLIDASATKCPMLQVLAKDDNGAVYIGKPIRGWLRKDAIKAKA